MDTTKKLNRKPDILAAELDGSTFMLDVSTGKYYNLGEVGGAIWALLERPLTLDELVEELVKQYDVTEEQCKKDTVPFVEKLLDRGLIVEV